jgi:carboxypeptidase C (cathepsin A)
LIHRLILVHRLIPQNTDILSEEYIKDEVKSSVESEIKAEKSENKSEKKTDLKQNKTLTEAVKNIAKGISETLRITQPSSSKDFKNEIEFSTGSDSDTSPILNNRRLSLENFRNKRQDFTDRSRGLSGPSKFSLSRKYNSIMVYDVNQEVGKYFDANEAERKLILASVPLGKEFEFLEKLLQDKNNVLQTEFKNKLRIKLAALLENTMLT